METRQMIELARTYKKISQAELARRLGMSPQSLNQKLLKGSWSIEDLSKVADALNIKFNCYFEFEARTKI